MTVKLDLRIHPQPTDETCGPTCLHALYRYYGDNIPLKQVIAEVPRLETGGTLAVWLGCHALRRGYQVKIYTYNLTVFDPTWFVPGRKDIGNRLETQLRFKKSRKLRTATGAYLQFLESGGELCFEELSKSLIRNFLNHSVPILTGLCATYLYRCAREFGPRMDYNDVRGLPTGHFVILSGYHKKNRTVEITDPLLPNPVSETHQYEVNLDRIIGAIFLGILTYDANLLIIQPG